LTATAVSLFSVAVAHFLFSYNFYLRTNYVGTAQFRYYLPIVPAFIASATLALLGIRNRAIQNSLIGFLLAFTLFASLVPLALATVLG